MPFIVQTVDEFSQMFPGVHHVFDGERFECFANGAVWDHERRCGFDPPSDPHDLDKAMVQYHQAVVFTAQEQFNRCDAWIRQALEFAKMNCGPLPPEESLADRRRFRATLIKAQTALEEAKAKIQLSPQTLARREYEAQRSAHRAKALQMLAELEGD